MSNDTDDRYVTESSDPVLASDQRVARRQSFARRLYNSDFHFDFIGKRRLWYILSGTLLAIAILGLVFRGLNLGIEFRGGSVFRAPVSVTQTTVTDFSDVVSELGLPDMDDMQVNTIGDDTVRVQTRTLTTEEVTKVRRAIAEKAGVASTDVAYQLIGPSWGSQITQKGFQALVVFLVLVALMIGVYFRNWKMSLSALVALLHDLILTVGIYALIGLTVTPATVIGVLTILGYSLYDNVVVFDKVKENTRDITSRNYSYTYAANRALNQVLVRSINTTIIGVLPVTAIMLAGIFWLNGQSALADLGTAMFVGMVAGAYSSIFLAVPLLAQLKEAEPEMVAHREKLARRANRGTTKVRASVATVDQPVSASGVSTAAMTITTAPVPVTRGESSATAASRPQPKHTPRSQRKK